MKEVKNKTSHPVRVPLGGGKVLHLGPRKNGQIADHAVELPGVKKLIEAGEIEVLGEGEHQESGSGKEAESSRGAGQAHHPKTVVLPKGDR